MIAQLTLMQSGRVSVLALLASVALAGCTFAPLQPPKSNQAANVNADATLTPTTRITRELTRLPRPMFKVPVAVYAFRDQTGQFKPQPDSNLSNAVTQGAASIVVKALLDSGWYLPIEREGFQNLLTERRVAKALESPTDKGKPGSSYPSLMAANYLIEGGVIGYESNVRTGGDGASLLGVGGDVKYRVDQVTVNLRSVDVRTGQVINSVSVTKTIFSHSLVANVYKFVAYKTLLQAEGGYTSNEPAQLAVKEAIESAVIHLTVQGIRDGAWALKDEKDWEQPLVQSYLREADASIAGDVAAASASVETTTVPMRASKLMLPPIPPLSVIPLRAVASNAPPPPTSPAPTPLPSQANATMPSEPVPSVPAPNVNQASLPAPVPVIEKKSAPGTQPATLPMPQMAPAQQAIQETAPLPMSSPKVTSDANPVGERPPAVPPREPFKEVPLPQAKAAPAENAVKAVTMAELQPFVAPLSSSLAEPMADEATILIATSGP